MAKETYSTEIKKQAIKDFENGIKQKYIAAKYNIGKSALSRIISKYRQTGKISTDHKGGRPKKTTKREDHLITRKVKINPFITAKQLKSDLNLNISEKTIRRRTREAGLRCYRPAKKPLISLKNKKKRLVFAQQHINWNINKWRTILFSDECKFNLIGSDGMCYVRRPKCKRLDPKYCKSTLKHGGGNLMVWGCVSGQGVGPIHLIDGIMDRFQYESILNNVMLPYAEWNMPIKWTFQHDNDPKHTAKSIKNWADNNRIQIMEWPAQSPDLNPIENLWSIVKTKINYKNIKTKEELFKEIKEAWFSIPQTMINNLIESMPRRCRDVIKNHGYYTKY